MKKNKFVLLTTIGCVLLSVFIIPIICFAAKTPTHLVKAAIWWAFRLAGILAFIMILYAGFLYLTAGGNTEQQKNAQNKIKNAIIGLVLLFSFYIILYTINPDILKISF